MTDNHNHDEFEHDPEMHEDPSNVAPTPTGIRANLAGAWRSQPLFKMFVLMVVAAAVIAIVVALLSGNTPKSSAVLLKPPDLHEAPGGKSSPYLKEQTEMANSQRTQEALSSGGSAMPTPIGPGTDNNDLSAAAQKEDPLNELRAEVADMNKQIQDTKQAQAAPPPAPAAPEQFDDSLAQAMQRQMSQLLDSWVPKGNRTVEVYDLEKLNSERDAAVKAQADAAKADAAAASQVSSAPKVIVNAGTVSYAQLLTEANSDVPGPIMALIVSGPLKGARAIGQFTVSEGSDYLVLTFKLADLKGMDYKIDALALDPDTTLGGMATETDQRYMTRLVLPAAAAFLQGFGSALGQGNSSITSNGSSTIFQQSSNGIKQGEYDGISAAAQTAGQFFQNQANLVHPLVRVAAGTPMGLFFVETVIDTPAAQLNAQEAAANANNVNAVNGVNGVNPFANGAGAGYPNPNGYNNGYNAGYANPNGAYPVLYPPGFSQGLSRNINGMNGIGMATQPSYGGGTGYPGTTVYYAH